MNYYERHLGDYAKDARHLTMLEHGAYTLLMDRYYATEQGIPADKAHRVAGARTTEEREAVDAVLAEFFTLVDGLWVKGRIEDEIARYRDSSEDNDDRRKHETERKRRYRQRRRELFAALRDVGIVPAFDTAIEILEDMVSRHVSHGTATGTSEESDRTGTANQTPDTSHKSDIETHATPAGEAGKAMRVAGCTSLNLSHPDFKAAIAEDVTPKELADAVTASIGMGITGAGLFAYAVKVARTNHAKTAAAVVIPTARAGPAQGQSKTMGAILALEGMKHGLDQTRTADGLPEAPYARLGTSAGG